MNSPSLEKLLIKIAKKQDALTARLDHLESHLAEEPKIQNQAPLKGLYFTANFTSPMQKVGLDQLRLELISLFENYGIIDFEGIFSK